MFAIIVGCNCIFAGLLLIIYAIFNNFIHGIVFHTINSLIDCVFEILYTLFPLIYLTSGDSIFDLRSLGLLKRQNWFILLQSLVAMIFLLNKCIQMTKYLDPDYIAKNYWNIRLESAIKTRQIHGSSPKIAWFVILFLVVVSRG